MMYDSDNFIILYKPVNAEKAEYTVNDIYIV